MTVAVAAPPVAAYERFRLSSDRYHQMIERGIFGEDERIELIEGGLVTMPPIGAEHSGLVKKLAELLFGLLHKRALISIQDPIHLDDFSEPEPDLALLRPRADYYMRSLPQPTDILLIIEVADSSLAYDRTVKMPLYARAGIAEAWIINLIDRWIEVYRDPSPVGHTTMLKILPGRAIAPQAFADVIVAVDDLFSA
ncbi:MAG TPA: Uma2 family endonuclease [Chloroflexi bacterium]|nr:Uma2 family endonuclease [Chloroflexota bacterium]